MTVITGDLLEFLTSGLTHMLDRGGKPAFVYLAEDGSGHMRLDDGSTHSGRWRLGEDGYTTDWDSGRTGDWQIERTDNGLDYVSRDGAQRLRMIGVFFGDSEGLGGS